MHTLEVGSFEASVDTLRSLELSENSLRHFPYTQLGVLKRLGALYIEFNELTSLRDENGSRGDWGHLKNSLVCLGLNGNYLTHLEEDSFTELNSLRELFLSENRLRFISPKAISPRSIIFDLRLSSNLLTDVPCFSWRSLALLSLEHNFLASLPCDLHRVIRLDVRNNRFRNSLLCQRYLQMNTTHIPEGFDCWLDKISFSRKALASFDERFVEILNSSSKLKSLSLEHNYLSALPASFATLHRLVFLFLSFNYFRSLPALPPRVEHLYLSGNLFDRLPARRLTTLRNLKTLDVSRNCLTHVAREDFEGWSGKLSALYLEGNHLVALEENVFASTPALQKLKLSHNRLSVVHEKIFASKTAPREIALSSNFLRGLPPTFEVQKSKLEILLLDNNEFDTFNTSTIDAYVNVKQLELQFNQIDSIEGLSGNCTRFSKVIVLNMPFNQVSQLQSSAFKCIKRVQVIDFYRNRIAKIQRQAFSDLPRLDYVFLDQNEINEIGDNAFNNLPFLQYIRLEFNMLSEFSFDWFARVGVNVTEPLEVNVSYNRIERLSGSGHETFIGVLDLSHNNIQRIPDRCFVTSGDRMRQLILSFNSIKELGNHELKGLPLLQRLDLSYNSIESIRHKAFQDLTLLQLLELSHNAIEFVSTELFNHQKALKHFELKGNLMNDIPIELLRNTMLESLILSNNSIAVYPSAIIERVGFTLRHLDLSHNNIHQLDKSMIFSTPFLFNLILKDNRISDIEEETFAPLEQIKSIDLSSNPLKVNLTRLLRPVTGLLYLNLSNVSLTRVPLLRLSYLTVLDLSYNKIRKLERHTFESLLNLKELYLQFNEIDELNSDAWIPLVNLLKLNLSGNPLYFLAPTLFLNLPSLGELSLSRLPELTNLETDTFVPLLSLNTLTLETCSVCNTTVGRLSGLEGLATLTLVVSEPSLSTQLRGLRAPRLKSLNVRGAAMVELSGDAFFGVRTSGRLALNITDTGISRIPEGMLRHLSAVERLSLDLSRNKLNSLDPAAFYPDATTWQRHGTKLISGGVRAVENPMRCGCEAAWASRWVRRWLREAKDKWAIGDREPYLSLTCVDSAGRSGPLLFRRLEAECGDAATRSPVSDAVPRRPLTALLLAICVIK